MANSNRDVQGVASYYNSQLGGSGHLNINGYAGTAYYNGTLGVGATHHWGTSNLSLNAFYGTSPVDEWNSGGGGGGK